MICSFESLKLKEVIDIKNGERVGFIDDVEINMENSEVIALIIYGRPRFFGILGRESDIIIPCNKIEVIGDDIILISGLENVDCSNSTKINRKFIENLFV